MAEDATALLVLWNDVEPALEQRYNDWHAHEHVPQRLTVPGILWGWRYRRSDAGDMPRYLTLYGLRHAAVLEGDAYQQLLRQPTPLSHEMRPALRNLSRWVCSLDVFRGMDPFADLSIQTWPAQTEDPPTPLPLDLTGASVAACLLAQRMSQARPLPWLSVEQRPTAASVTGHWLYAARLAAEPGADRARTDGANVFTSLSVR